MPGLNWDGAVPRKIRLTVVDASTTAPVAAAKVSFGGRDVGVTDVAGECEWTGMFPAGGSAGLFGRSGRWLVYGELTIRTTGGWSRTVYLEDLVAEKRRSLRDDDPIVVTVPLTGAAKLPVAH
jgi:hypothetical protein